MNLKKRIIATLAICLLSASAIFAATMDPYKGYKDLKWGTTVKQAKDEGYKLSLLDDTSASPMKAQFTKNVDFYFVKANDKAVQGLYFAYYNDKLFMAMEILASSHKDLKKLQSRYGSDVTAFQNGFMNFRDGRSSLLIVNSEGNYIASIYDYDVYTSISVQSQSAQNGSSGSQGFVSQFDDLANKLLQPAKKGSKASYAFLDFTTDDKNTLVEKYITDALTESVFNTGKVKIIERANIEKILSEQKFQASGLVNESQAANIGNIAGVEYVCYGTIKEITNGYTVNARVVDVESGEICAMSRTNVTKDSYLANNAGKSSSRSTSSTKSTAAKKPANSLWTCTKNRNEFDGYTTYTFVCKGPEGEFLFMGYDKFDNSFNSRVRAGVCWDDYYNTSNIGNYDFKTESQGTISKNFYYAYWSYTTGWKDNSATRFAFCYNQNESARFFINLFENNKFLTIRHRDSVRRFQAQGFWETVESHGVTKQEILDAIANEEF